MDSRKVQIYKKQNCEKSSKVLSRMFLSLMSKLHKEGVKNINGQHRGRRITLLHCDYYSYFFLLRYYLHLFPPLLCLRLCQTEMPMVFFATISKGAKCSFYGIENE